MKTSYTNDMAYGKRSFPDVLCLDFLAGVLIANTTVHITLLQYILYIYTLNIFVNERNDKTGLSGHLGAACDCETLRQ